MLEDSVRTELTPAWQQARRSRKRRGSVACSEQGRGSGVTRSQPTVSVSHIRLRVSFLEDKTQWGVNASQCHTVANVAHRCCAEVCVVCLCIQPIGTSLVKRSMGSNVNLTMTHLLSDVIAGSPLLVNGMGSFTCVATEFSYYPRARKKLRTHVGL